MIDLSSSEEIEDRLLVPTSTVAVALDKMVLSTLRAPVAAVVTFPPGIWVLGSVPWRTEGLGWVVALRVLLALLVLWALTGATPYPWPALGTLRWFQVVTALDPLTDVSEGLRGTLTPLTPHIPTAPCVAVLVSFLAPSTATGVRGSSAGPWTEAARRPTGQEPVAAGGRGAHDGPHHPSLIRRPA